MSRPIESLRFPRRFSELLGDSQNSSGILRDLKKSLGNSQGFSEINSGRPQTDHFHGRMGGRSHFSTALAQPGPGGAQKRPDRVKNSKQKIRQRDLSVDTAGSFVVEDFPIGMEQQQPWYFSRAFRVHTRAPRRDAPFPRAF